MFKKATVGAGVFAVSALTIVSMTFAQTSTPTATPTTSASTPTPTTTVPSGAPATGHAR